MQVKERSPAAQLAAVMQQERGNSRKGQSITLKRIDFNLMEMVPDDWFTSPESSSIWIAGYRLMRISPIDLPEGPKYFDLEGVRVFLTYGSIDYLDSNAATPRITDHGDYKVDASAIEKTTPEGGYTFLVLPFDVDGQHGNERLTRERIADVVGLLAALNERNMAYEHVFEYVNRADGKERSVISATLVNPMSMPKPDMGEGRLQTLSAVDAGIHAMEDSRRNRIRLSLRWFQAALFDIGVDAYLKYWIAIETLAMPDTTNIRPVNEALSRIYGIPLEDASQRYQIGRLFDLRGRIVHQGSQIPISGKLLDYAESIYSDLLLDAAGSAPESRAESFLSSESFDPVSDLSSL